MELTKPTYTISRETLRLVIEALDDNSISSNGEREFNNDDVIIARWRLEDEIARKHIV